MSLALLDDTEVRSLPQTSEEISNEIENALVIPRHLCLTDLFYLATEILGYHDLTSRLHRPLCDLVQSVNPLIIEQAGDQCLLRTIRNNDCTTTGTSRHDTCPTSNNHATSQTNNDGTTLASSTNHANLPNNNNHRGESDCGVGGGGGEVCGGLQNPIQNFQVTIPNSVITSGLGKFITVGDNKHRLFLLHRSSFKTTIISIAHTIQLMLLWPEIRILINSHSKETGAMPILNSIRQQFIGNDKLRLLFPECVPQADKTGKIEFGTTERVIMPNRSKSCAWPEGTVEVAGMTTNIAGRHFDYIKNDDMVTDASVTNESMIQKTRGRKSLQAFLFSNLEKGIADNIGTVYHFNDLYSELKKQGLTTVIMPVWDENENIVCYERHSKEGLLKEKNRLGDYEFSCQMLLNPIPPESQTFRPEWLERLGFNYEPVEIEGVPMRVAAYFDPANSKRKKSDYTAHIVIGVDNEGTKFLLDVGRDKLNVEERTNLVMDVCRKWKLHKVHYETIGFQDTDKYIIDRKTREQKYYIEVVEIKASQSSKEDRIRGLQPLYQRGNIRWPRKLMKYVSYEGKNMDMIQCLKDEMMMFPKCIHDDMLDVHSFMLQVEEYNATKAHVAKTENTFERLQKTLRPAETRARFYKSGKHLRNRYYELPHTKCVI